MPAAMKMSSHPSALKSSTLGPQGQYVSTPTASDTSSNRPPPRFANSAFPKMRPPFPFGNNLPDTCDESSLRISPAQSPAEVDPHVRVHAGGEEVEPTVAIAGEHIYAH